jgi:hypothetical protein
MFFFFHYLSKKIVLSSRIKPPKPHVCGLSLQEKIVKYSLTFPQHFLLSYTQLSPSLPRTPFDTHPKENKSATILDLFTIKSNKRQNLTHKRVSSNQYQSKRMSWSHPPHSPEHNPQTIHCLDHLFHHEFSQSSSTMKTHSSPALKHSLSLPHETHLRTKLTNEETSEKQNN